MTIFKVGDLVTPATLKDAEWCGLQLGEIAKVTGFSYRGNIRINGGVTGYYPHRFKPAFPNKSLEDYM